LVSRRSLCHHQWSPQHQPHHCLRKTPLPLLHPPQVISIPLHLR
jgi:hypothetical protein